MQRGHRLELRLDLCEFGDLFLAPDLKLPGRLCRRSISRRRSSIEREAMLPGVVPG